MKHPELRELLVNISRKVFERGLVSQRSGNLSIRLDENLILITPKSKRYENIQANDLVCITLDGEIIDGNREPSSEWQLHREIYLRRNDVKAIIHTHSICGSILASLEMPLPVILDEQREQLGGDIKVARYAPCGTYELARNAVEALEGRKACILSRHGVVAVGESLDEAFDVCELIERFSKIYIFMCLLSKERNTGEPYSLASK